MTFAVWLGLAGVIVALIRREFRHQIYIQRAQAQRYTPWPVERYVVGATLNEGWRIEARTVTTTWPQVARWAEQRSSSPAVAEAYVIRRDPWWRVTTWTWQDGRQVRRVSGSEYAREVAR
ncbi:hypothetical protein FHS43_004453 [Streptosporangium becharense]|uniref:Uncharacterized protein n=1 Tax=Streptosporangium becharense TaxID=1816182 RepID=A0A7W9IJX8_9ACTN|nr:hypothetical protein [Streptosporangium becharense]MBB2913155.1 hypothetical protein [Streptosporangium becharense]MBB5822138.1 hypothetical protein [Streptosporangium becharense]